MRSKPKAPKVQATPMPAPAPTPVSSDVGMINSEREANKKVRRKSGFTSTQVAGDRTILGAVNQAVSAMKKTLG